MQAAAVCAAMEENLVPPPSTTRSRRTVRSGLRAAHGEAGPHRCRSAERAQLRRDPRVLLLRRFAAIAGSARPGQGGAASGCRRHCGGAGPAGGSRCGSRSSALRRAPRLAKVRQCLNTYALLVTACTTAHWGWWRNLRAPDRPSNRLFRVPLLWVTAWTICTVMVLLSTDADAARNLLRLVHLFSVLMVTSFVDFIWVFRIVCDTEASRQRLVLYAAGSAVV